MIKYKGLRKQKNQSQAKKAKHVFLFLFLEKKMAKAIKNSRSSQVKPLYENRSYRALSLSLVNIFLTSNFGFSHARSLSLPSLVKLAKLQ